MTRSVSIQQIETLWARYAEQGPSSEEIVTHDALLSVIAELGLDAGAGHAQHMLENTAARDGLRRGPFFALVATLQGDRDARARIAFDMLDADGDGKVSQHELYELLKHFGMSETECERLFHEADREGAAAISFEDFRALLSGIEPVALAGYRDSHIAPVTRPAFAKELASQPGVRSADKPQHHRKAPGQGTSRLQMQIGLFRLLQGAAYRSFRENCAANCETHLRAKALPYTITHFVAFADAAIDLYKALGIVEPACNTVLDGVKQSLHDEFARLQDRIANWKVVEKTPQMEAAAATMAAERYGRRSIHDVLTAGIELALTLQRKELKLDDLEQGALAAHELMRQRGLDLHLDSAPTDEPRDGAAGDYLETWSHVILEDTDEEIDGAIMPAAYWYEDFMPKLLAACSVSTAADIPANTEPDEEALDRWFHHADTAGEFHPFGEAVAARFKTCTPRQKLEIRQAWRLTRHYLNGVQKRRERLEFGRETGFLSEYVAFLDVYLGRSDVRDARMRVSFPYFIGPPTWRFLHTTAEIICRRDATEQSRLVELFKDFFRLFATMYPCPYCRYHLNRFVVCNREVDMYPLEYLILGSHPEDGGFEVSIEDKLNAISDGASLRLFLWKLHNAVSSSIARTEAWYHREEDAPYTTRFWPSLDEERARIRAFGLEELSETDIDALGALQRPVEELSGLRRTLASVPGSGEVEPLAKLVGQAHAATGSLEQALAKTGYLEKTYRFDPALKDDAPHFTPDEVAFSRSGRFVEA